MEEALCSMVRCVRFLVLVPHAAQPDLDHTKGGLRGVPGGFPGFFGEKKRFRV